VHDLCPALENVDRWVWKDDEFLETKGDRSWMFKVFWRIKALPLAHVTTWRMLENKIATKDNLVRRSFAASVG